MNSWYLLLAHNTVGSQKTKALFSVGIQSADSLVKVRGSLFPRNLGRGPNFFLRQFKLGPMAHLAAVPAGQRAGAQRGRAPERPYTLTF
jgi:hypothetical protein